MAELSPVAAFSRVSSALRGVFNNVDAYLSRLDPAGWREQSYCKDWKVYQVVSHLGSGAEIMGRGLEAGLRETTPLDDEGRRAIWARFDALGPDGIYPAFLEANRYYFSVVDSVGQGGEQEYERLIPAFRGPVTPAQHMTLRLSEFAIHAWDIAVVRRPAARISQPAVDILVDNLADRVGRLAHKDVAAALGGKAIAITLVDPPRSFVLSFADGTAALGHGGNTQASLAMAAESFIRLLTGRLDGRQLEREIARDLARARGDRALIAALPDVFRGF